MANLNFSEVIPSIYAGLNIVSREQVGFIPSVMKNTGAERAAKDETIRIPVGSAGAIEDIAEAMTAPNTGDVSMGYVDMKIDNAKVVPFHWTGEEELGVSNNGKYNKILAEQFADCFRKLTNQVEKDIAKAAVEGASRAFGTAGTAPFATAGDLSDIANIAKILDENGAPIGSRNLVLSSSAMATLRGKQSLLLKVNEAGSKEFLRTGYTAPIENFKIWSSAGLTKHTKGAGASYVTNLTSSAVEKTEVIGIDGGSGKIGVGDVVAFEDDTNLYVVRKDITGAGNLEINAPGLMQGLADGKTVTVGGDYTPSIGFTENAICLITRAPKVPSVGDLAVDSTLVTDPVSGLTFEVRVYGGYRQVRFEVGLAWGVKCIKPEHCAILLG